MSPTPPQTLLSRRLNSTREAVPVILQVCGLFGFIAAQVIWLGFKRPEPEFMAICIGVAATGYVGEGLNVLRGGSPGPPPPPGLPPASDTSQDEPPVAP